MAILLNLVKSGGVGRVPPPPKQKSWLRRCLKRQVPVLSTTFFCPPNCRPYLLCECGSKQVTFYTTPVLLLLSVSSITVGVHRNSLQRSGKRGELKKLKSYTMNPQAAKLNAVRCLVNVDKFSLMTVNSVTAVTCQLRVSSNTVCVHRNSLQ